jgi:hypothetical protein
MIYPEEKGPVFSMLPVTVKLLFSYRKDNSTSGEYCRNNMIISAYNDIDEISTKEIATHESQK